jgi:hypothetical protein
MKELVFTVATSNSWMSVAIPKESLRDLPTFSGRFIIIVIVGSKLSVLGNVTEAVDGVIHL